MKNWLRRILFVFFLCIFLYSGYNLITYYLEGTKQDTIQQEISQYVPTDKIIEHIEKPKEEEHIEVAPTVNWEELKKRNKEIVGYIYIPYTRIRYPVVHRYNDNDYYLRRTVDEEYNVGGSIFVDGKNKHGDLTDQITTLYGHNMLNGSMFADIKRFNSYDFMKSNPYFYYFTEKGNYKIEIIRYDTVDVYNKIYQRDLLNLGKENVTTYLSRLNSNFVGLGVEVLNQDKLVLLSTCRDAEGDRRLTLLGKVIEIK